MAASLRQGFPASAYDGGGVESMSSPQGVVAFLLISRHAPAFDAAVVTVTCVIRMHALYQDVTRETR